MHESLSNCRLPFFFQCCFVLKKKLEIERDVLNAHRSICCYCILLTFWHYSTSRMHRQAAEDDVVSHDATNQTHIYMLSHGAVKGVKSILFLGWTFFYLFLWCGLFYLEFFNILFSSILIQLKAVKLKWSSSWFYYFDQNKIYCLEWDRRKQIFFHTKNSNYVMLFECEIAAVSFDTRKI